MKTSDVRTAPLAGLPRSAANTPHDVVAIANELRRAITADLRRRGYDGLRPSFAPLFGLVWDEPSSQRELAEHLGVSMAAVSQLVSLGEELGYLERRPNPLDGRSKLVELTPRGRRFTSDGGRAIVAERERYEGILGNARCATFVKSLEVLMTSLGAAGATRLVLSIDPRAALAAVIVVAERWVRELHGAVAGAGFRDLGPRQNTLLVFIDDGGARASELARARGVSRQAVTATLHELEAMGYVKRERGSSAGFVLAARGRRHCDVYTAQIDALEAKAAAALGALANATLVRTAHELRTALRRHAEGQLPA